MRLDLKKGSVYLIDLPQNLERFRNFISSWVILTPNYNFLIDVGPSSTVPLLLKKLKGLGVNIIDYVFLTHIHIDHAGGVGHLIENFPKLKVVAHEKSKAHLLNPEKIWEGSKHTLGEIALSYGGIMPVPLENLANETETIKAREILKIIDTPGHAAHHLSFLYQDVLFAGEAGGIYLDGEIFYLRPATPPRFFFEAAIRSLDKLMGLTAEKICYGHYGYSHDALRMLNIYREQLFLWQEVIKSVAQNYSNKSKAEIAFIAFEKLLKEDKIFSRYLKLDKDIREREKYFILNSIKGYLEQGLKT